MLMRMLGREAMHRTSSKLSSDVALALIKKKRATEVPASASTIVDSRDVHCCST